MKKKVIVPKTVPNLSLSPLEKFLAGKKLNFGWKQFEILFANKLELQGEDCFGLCDFDEAKISLLLGMSDVQMRETLLHEVIHVVEELVGYGEDSIRDLARLDNENLTESMTRGMLLFANLNPDMVELLLCPSKTAIK